MGLFKKIVGGIEGMAKKKVEEDNNPDVQRQKKKDAANRNFKRAAEAVKMTQKGLKKYGDASKKADELRRDGTRKAAELAEKAKPAAEKADKGAAAVASNMAARAADLVRQANGALTRAEDYVEQKKYDLMDKAKPVTDKVTVPTQKALGRVWKKISDVTEEQRQKAHLPKNSGGLLDMIAPAVPEESGKSQADAKTEDAKPSRDPQPKPPAA